MKKITIYKNLDHQQKLEIDAILELSPSERIAQVVAIIKRIYPQIESESVRRIKFNNEHFS